MEVERSLIKWSNINLSNKTGLMLLTCLFFKSYIKGTANTAPTRLCADDDTVDIHEAIITLIKPLIIDTVVFTPFAKAHQESDRLLVKLGNPQHIALLP